MNLETRGEYHKSLISVHSARRGVHVQLYTVALHSRHSSCNHSPVQALARAITSATWVCATRSNSIRAFRARTWLAASRPTASLRKAPCTRARRERARGAATQDASERSAPPADQAVWPHRRCVTLPPRPPPASEAAHAYTPPWPLPTRSYPPGTLNAGAAWNIMYIGISLLFFYGVWPF